MRNDWLGRSENRMNKFVKTSIGAPREPSVPSGGRRGREYADQAPHGA
jgi:hypothetical protein